MVGRLFDALQASATSARLTTGVQSWFISKTFSAYHNVPFSSKTTDFADLTLAELECDVQVKHIDNLVSGRDASLSIRAVGNEGGAPFRAGECGAVH